MNSQTKYLIEALDVAPEGVVLWDADGQLVMCNQKFRELHQHISEFLKPGLKIEEILRRQKESGLRGGEEGESDSWDLSELASRNQEFIPDVTVKYGENWFQIRRKKMADGSIIAFHTDITKIKKSEERFKQVFQSSPALVSISTVESSTILDVNPHWLKSLGFEKDEVIGKSPFDLGILVEPDVRSTVIQRLDSGGHIVVETKLKTKGGKILDCLTNAEFIEFEGQECYLFISQDITDRKLVETALLESEKKFRISFEHAGIGMTVTGLDGEFIAVNPAFCKMLGYEERDLVGSSVLEFTHPEDQQKTSSDRDSVLNKSTTPIPVEKRFIRKNGDVMWGVLTRAAVKDLEGNAQYIIGQIQDVTERRILEDRYRSLFEQATEGIVIRTPDTLEIIDCNEVFASRLGYTREELIGESVSKFSIGPAVPQRSNKLQKLAVGENHTVQRIHRRKNGEIFPVEVSSSLVVQGSRQLVLTFIRDITERRITEDALKLAHEKLEDRVKARTKELENEVNERKKIQHGLMEANLKAKTANRTKSEFLANISHELRTPLNAIIGFSDAMLHGVNGELASQTHRDYVGHIHSSGEHLLQLINSILDISVIEAGKLELQKAPVDLTDLVRSLLFIVEPKVGLRKINFINTITEELPLLFVDELRLKQVLVNLLSNAIKFTPEGGRVELGCELDDNSGIKITVLDTGIGMDKEGVERALLKFGQSHKGLEEIEGTGLGLPLAEELIKAHGGKLSINSELGKGTTVVVDIPDARVNESTQ